MKALKKASVVLMLLLAGCLSARAQKDDFSVLYFYSHSCTPCNDIAPMIKDLSREFAIQGFASRPGRSEDLPFKVDQADEGTLSRYSIDQFPTLVVMMHDTVKQIFVGEKDIKDAGLMLRAFRIGALSVSELVKKKPQDRAIVAGWVVSKGEYFKDAEFYLTDRKNTILLRPWLPLEAILSPWRKDRPRLMSDVVNRAVVLEGSFTKSGEKLQFTVQREVMIE
jgi:thiol-disulfide isomerase/thioredoxin